MTALLVGFLLLASLEGAILGFLMGFLSLFLILLVLIQRGKGGGLTGALGGPGGQSAFGSKAGDTFTVITVVVATVWAFSCAFTMWLLGTHAPSTTTVDSAVSAVGDDSAASSETLNLPSLDADGLSGLEAELSGGDDAKTNAVELTPATSGDAPAMEAPAEEAPATEKPAEETPAEKKPAEEKPAAEAADASATPAPETPAATEKAAEAAESDGDK